MFLTSENFAAIPSAAHGFFTRKGGVSNRIYNSLNCGPGSDDDQAHVQENRTRVAKMLSAKPENLCSLYQVHGKEVITVKEPWAMGKGPKADAMVTDRPGLALGILTADCVPVLFACGRSNVVGAAHAGWKGAYAGVLEATLDAMRLLGASSASITCAIGPAIGRQSYEVKDDFRANFLQQNDANDRFFAAGKDGHFLFDVKGYVHARLADAGIEDVNILENDTFLEEDDFFSYRRTTHRGEPDYGRQISAIMIR